MQCIITITSHQNDRRTKGGRRAQLNSLCCAIDTMTLVLILIDHVIVAHEHDHDYLLVLFLSFFLSNLRSCLLLLLLLSLYSR